MTMLPDFRQIKTQMKELVNDTPKLKKFDLSSLKDSAKSPSWNIDGRIVDISQNMIEAFLPNCKMGMVCQVLDSEENVLVQAEVIEIRDKRALLLPYTEIGGISSGMAVRQKAISDNIFVGDHLQGKVLDAFLVGFDEDPPLDSDTAPEGSWVPIDRPAPNPMTRSRIEKPMSLGIKAIDGLLTFGEGQRLAIMAGSGVGKSVLLGMMARGDDADINVIALLGERGRELKEFIEKDLGEAGLKKSIVIVVTSDQSPLMVVRGAKVATAIAEYFSSTGKRVLLMLDSLTRVAQAQRMIGTIRKEPPTTKGYTPSVFSLLPKLLERCGPQPKGRGSISALYTVLVDGDDFNDPLPDAIRAIVDGHIVLSRDLHRRGHYPAIDVNASLSRVMFDIVDRKHWIAAQRIKELVAVYNDNFDYIQMGTYQPGSNPTLDQAIALMPYIQQYLRQDIFEESDMELSLGLLMGLFARMGIEGINS